MPDLFLITKIGCICCVALIGVVMIIISDNVGLTWAGIFFITIALGVSITMVVYKDEFISQPTQMPSRSESTTFNIPAPIEKTPYYENAPFKPAPTVAPNNQWGNINNVAQQPIDNNMFSGFDNPALQ